MQSWDSINTGNKQVKLLPLSLSYELQICVVTDLQHLRCFVCVCVLELIAQWRDSDKLFLTVWMYLKWTNSNKFSVGNQQSKNLTNFFLDSVRLWYIYIFSNMMTYCSAWSSLLSSRHSAATVVLSCHVYWRELDVPSSLSACKRTDSLNESLPSWNVAA